jgi:hypothetical protein
MKKILNTLNGDARFTNKIYLQHRKYLNYFYDKDDNVILHRLGHVFREVKFVEIDSGLGKVIEGLSLSEKGNRHPIKISKEEFMKGF